jgi:hypothetical protein
MRLKSVGDLSTRPLCRLEIDIDISVRVHHSSAAAVCIGNEIGLMPQSF